MTLVLQDMARNKPCPDRISGFADECCGESLVSSAGFTLCPWPSIAVHMPKPPQQVGKKRGREKKKGKKKLVLKYTKD